MMRIIWINHHQRITAILLEHSKIDGAIKIQLFTFVFVLILFAIYFKLNSFSNAVKVSRMHDLLCVQNLLPNPHIFRSKMENQCDKLKYYSSAFLSVFFSLRNETFRGFCDSKNMLELND